ncbi:hypothetical protein P9J83_15855 [Clostridium sporogenes]|uniref:Uncharacterized protein n=1 Tax=Clostridium sporogenes TaxID=1509 RepID=A0AAE4JWA6_CLOSG|nr:hypothetical protein [Clostridium sporogenes]MDS1004959.1 hypothetical protein [Clostridium sporogenes]
MLFKKLTKENYTEEEIGQILDISNIAVKRLVKTINKHVGRYESEDIIRACMGGRLY